MSSPSTATVRSPNNGFFSSFSSALGGAVGESLGAVAGMLPVWTAKQLDLQSKDQLQRPTFDPVASPRRINDSLETTGGQATTESPAPRNAGVLFDNIQISGTALVGLVVAVVAGIAIARA